MAGEVGGMEGRVEGGGGDTEGGGLGEGRLEFLYLIRIGELGGF